MKITDAFFVKPISSSQTFLEIYKCIRPLYLMSRYIGLFSVDITPRKKKAWDQHDRTKDRKKEWCYFGAFMVFYIGLGAYVVTALGDEGKKVFKISETLLLIYFCAWSLFPIVALTISFTTKSFIVRGLKLLSEADACFLKHGHSLEYAAIKKFSYKLIVAMSLSVGVRSVIVWASIKFDPVQQLALFIGAFLKSMTKYQYVVFTYLVKTRYRKIIEVIGGMQKASSKNVNLTFNSEGGAAEARDTLYLMCRLHFKLCNILRTWNVSFAFLLLVSLFISLCHVLFHCYYLYYMLSGRAQCDALTISQPILYLVGEAIEIYVLIGVCDETCEFANRTPIVLHQLRNTVSNIELERQIQVYSLQLLHQKVEFSVLGFFEIDYSLIYAMISVVTTYLVIFIQFDQSQQNRKTLESVLNTTATYEGSTLNIN